MSTRAPRASARLVITNRLGLHARAARLLVECVRYLDAEVIILKGDQTANCKAILDLMMLAAGPGTELEVVATGPDAEQAVAAVTQLVEQRFHEPA
jgi:phosphotransferase system HPr (HPr) family protein